MLLDIFIQITIKFLFQKILAFIIKNNLHLIFILIKLILIFAYNFSLTLIFTFLPIIILKIINLILLNFNLFCVQLLELFYQIGILVLYIILFVFLCYLDFLLSRCSNLVLANLDYGIYCDSVFLLLLQHSVKQFLKILFN